MARSAANALPKEDPELTQFVESVQSGEAGSNAYVLLVGLRVFDSVRLRREVQRGISYRSFARFSRNLDISLDQLSDLVQIGRRTLSRRRAEGRLRPDESDRLLRAGRLFGLAIQLFEGDVAAARQWLTAPQKTLGGAVPLDLARSELGAREVEAAIWRIEHGVFG